MGDAGRDGDEVGARLATTGSSSAHLAHMVVVRAPSSSRFDALGAFERRGLHVVGLASDGGELLIALRCADASAAAAVRSTCAALTPPASATPTQQAALEQLHRHFYDRPSLAHWETEEDAWVAPRPTLLGTHGDGWLRGRQHRWPIQRHHHRNHRRITITITDLESYTNIPY